MISTEQMTREEMVQAAKTHRCGECGLPLNVAWVKGEWALRCQNQTHSTITRHDKRSEEIRQEIRRMQNLDSTALATMPQDRMLARIDMAKFPKDLSPTDKKALAVAAISYGFDPLMGEITIYQGRPYVSIDGRYRKAQETGQLDGVMSRPARKEEREEWEIPAGDYFVKAEVYVKGAAYPFVGWGRVHKSETAGNEFLPLTKDPQRMAEKRAEAQALRKAFHIPLPSIEDIGAPDERPFIEGQIVSETTTRTVAAQPKAVEKAPKAKPERDLAGILTINFLYEACHEDFGMQPADVLKELGVATKADIAETPADCYKRIAAVRV